MLGIYNLRKKNLILACLGVLLLPSLAFAHAHLKGAEPGKDAKLAQAPSGVTLHFSEKLELAMCKIEVKNLDTGAVISEPKSIEAAPDGSTLHVSLKPLPNEKAKFQVNWKAVARDSHSMKGSYEFSIVPKAP